MDRSGAGGGRGGRGGRGGGGEEDEAGGGRRRRRQEEEATDIKSNNPHLAGGEKKPSHVLPLQTHAFLSHKPVLPSSCLALNLTWLAQMYSLVSDIMLD